MLDLPNGVPPEIIRQLMDNVLVVLAKRAGGVLTVTVKEVDDAVETLIMESNVAEETFTFRLVPTKKEGTH